MTADIGPVPPGGYTPYHLSIPVEQNVAKYIAWMKEQQGTREYLEEAERVMREQRVVRRVGRGGGRVSGIIGIEVGNDGVKGKDDAIENYD